MTPRNIVLEEQVETALAEYHRAGRILRLAGDLVAELHRIGRNTDHAFKAYVEAAEAHGVAARKLSKAFDRSEAA